MAIERSGLADGLVRQVLAVGIDGRGAFKGAREIAAEHLASYSDPDRAAHKLVSAHVRLAAASGFVTGLGGIAALPVTVPAALAGLYVLAGRMTAAIAHVRGHDLDAPEVRSAVLVALLGRSGDTVLREAGVEPGSTVDALARVPATTLATVDHTVGLRLVARAGERGLVNLGKLVPVVGAPIGATMDAAGCRAIASHALAIFAPRRRMLQAEITDVLIHRPDPT